jgi:hypothetical protein
MLSSQSGCFPRSIKQQCTEEAYRGEESRPWPLAAKAEADATAQQQAVTDNAAAVTTLQSSVKDLSANQASLTSTISDETTNMKKMITSPDAIYFKGVTLSPTGSFLAAETVWRSAAIGSDINTPFTSVPLANSEAAQLTEFFGSGRQSRAALKATGKLSNVTLTGYYEADWLGTGTSSNNNQSNSYVLRQRQLWGDAKTSGGWDFSGGQGWSLVTETTQGLTRGSEILPATIDAAYEPGFVWTRQESFRVSKDFGKSFFLGLSAENPETLNPGGNNLPINATRPAPPGRPVQLGPPRSLVRCHQRREPRRRRERYGQHGLHLASLLPAVTRLDASKKGSPRGLPFNFEAAGSYSAASTAFVCATVQSGAPTLKRAKRRTVIFSPSFPTFCAISSLMLTAWSLINGCSSRQTSS